MSTEIIEKIKKSVKRALEIDELNLVTRYLIERRMVAACRENTGVHDITVKRLAAGKAANIVDANKVVEFAKLVKKVVDENTPK